MIRRIAAGLLTAGLFANVPAMAQNGEALFQECTTCHSLEGEHNDVGPSLKGLFERNIGTAPGYRYSAALRNAGAKWTDETLDKFLADPQKEYLGNRMPFSGMADAAARKAIIEYLKVATK